jgi:ribosomal protein S6E (S10)
MHKRPKKEGKKQRTNKNPKGLRLRKTVRGKEISLDTVQINTKVLKEGSKKFEELITPKQEE